MHMTGRGGAQLGRTDVDITVAVRIIAKAEFRAHSTPLFKKYNLLKLMDICQFQIALFMFKFNYFQITVYVQQLFYLH